MQDINIYEAMPLLQEMLNISGVQKRFIKKSHNWLQNKLLRGEFYSCPIGFTQSDVDLLNEALASTAEYISARVLKLPSECNDVDIYQAYAAKTIKELRLLISMSYICEHYCDFNLRTMQKKVRGELNAKGYPNRINEKNVQEINTGIRSVAELLSNIHLTL